jgi:AcrR family transcriptional regulator
MSMKRPKSLRRLPKQARAHDTIEVVLEAAARVLRERGYAGATTNRIADAAGVGVGTVYEYFSNKDTVFEAVIAREIGRLVTAFQAEARAEAAGGGAGIGIDAAITRLIGAGIRAMEHGPELFRALEAVPGASFRRQLSVAREGVIELVHQMFEAHRDEVAVDDLKLAAYIVVGAIEGVAGNASSADLGDPLVTELTALATRYLKGARGPT